MKAKWLGAALVFAAMGGCDTTNNFTNGTPDLAGGASPAPVCAPNAKECVSSTLARVCPADGSGWLAVPCNNGETCNGGDCGLDVNTVPCLPSDSFCSTDTTALICNDSGMGFHMSTCPANTTCVNSGQCAGSCIIGSTQCQDVNTSLHCNDGFILTPSPCPSGQACSDSLGDCAPAACTPNNCAAECGNKSMDPTNTDSGFFSFCQDNGLGFQWVAVACSAPKTCSPTAACNAQLLTDACTSECVPGEVRCTDDGTGTQTCDNTGKFGAVTQCDAGNGKKCVSDINGVALGCGDTICDFGGTGYCLVDGGVSKLRACDSTGNLGPLNRLTTCTIGFCFEDPNGTQDDFTGHFPGACTPQCQSGDSQCAGAGSVQGCDPTTLLWSSTTTPCFTTDPNSGCFNFTLGGRPRAVCGICQPGDIRCTGANASPSPAPTDFVESCGQNGQWGTNTACVASHCEDGLGCVANCIPGKEVCDVADDPGLSPSAAPVGFGLANFRDCTADGKIGPVPSPCPKGQSCRMDSNGNSYGCVVCVGTQNEGGVADTQCTTSNPPNVQTCKPDNTGYQASATPCPAGDLCNPMDDPHNSFTPEVCDLDEPFLQFLTGDPTATCTAYGEGATILCAGDSLCCSFDCEQASSSAAPATCSAP